MDYKSIIASLKRGIIEAQNEIRDAEESLDEKESLLWLLENEEYDKAKRKHALLLSSLE